LSDWLSKGIFKANPITLREGGIKAIPEGIAHMMSGQVSISLTTLHRFSFTDISYQVSGSKLVFKV